VGPADPARLARRAAVEGVLAAHLQAAAAAGYACVIDERGEVLAESGDKGAADVMGALLRELHALGQAHPRGTPRRVFIEDDAGLVVMERRSSRSLVMLAPPEASLGAVTRALGKLSDQLPVA
jgi:hypothetical protein